MMKTLQRTLGAALLTCTLSLSAFAGEMPLGATAARAGEMSTDVTAVRAIDISTDFYSFFEDVWAMLAGSLAGD